LAPKIPETWTKRL